MNARIIPVLILVVCCSAVWDATAMPGAQHAEGAEKLVHTPAEQGGALGVTRKKLRSIQRWMDRPAQQTGQYVNQTTGTPVTPSNHGHLRHNPEAVARAMSGNGTPDPAVRNVARLHKVQDVVHNTAPVDGWQITDGMRREGQQILDHVDQRGALPKRMPEWVDQPGPMRKPPAQPTTVRPPGGVLRGIGRKAGAVGAAVETCLRGKDALDTERAYRNGELGRDQRVQQHSENAGGAVGGTAGAMTGAKIGAVAGAPGGPPGSIAGAIVGGVVGGYAGDRLGEQAGRTAAEHWRDEP